MTPDEMRQSLRRSVRMHVLISYVAIFGLFGGMFAWAYLTKVSGAIIASGTLVASSHNKVIQHPDGGVIKKIYVKNGDMVDANALLIRLDSSLIRTNLHLARNSYFELLAEGTRIKAELEGNGKIVFPREFYEQIYSQDVQGIIQQNNDLLGARVAMRGRNIAQLQTKIAQINASLNGMHSQANARKQEIDIVKTRVRDMEILYEKGLLSASNIAAVQRDEYRLSGLLLATYSEVDRMGQELNELRLQIISVEEDARAEMIARVQKMRMEIVQAKFNMGHAQKQLSRIEIRAPNPGIIHDLSVHTIGGVIRPAEPVLEILPVDDDLVLELKVKPVDIEQVYSGQTVSIQFPGLNARTASRLNAKLRYVSGDLLHDPLDGQKYYMATAQLEDGELDKLAQIGLIAGMPAVAFIETRQRTVLTYLVEPLKNQIALVVRLI